MIASGDFTLAHDYAQSLSVDPGQGCADSDCAQCRAVHAFLHTVRQHCRERCAPIWREWVLGDPNWADGMYPDTEAPRESRAPRRSHKEAWENLTECLQAIGYSGSKETLRAVFQKIQELGLERRRIRRQASKTQEETRREVRASSLLFSCYHLGHDHRWCDQLRKRPSALDLSRQSTKVRNEIKREANLKYLKQSTQKAPGSPFAKLAQEHLEALADKVVHVEVPKAPPRDADQEAATVIKQGEESTDLYIVVSGMAIVKVTEKATRPLFPGAVFGEGAVRSTRVLPVRGCYIKLCGLSLALGFPFGMLLADCGQLYLCVLRRHVVKLIRCCSGQAVGSRNTRTANVLNGSETEELHVLRLSRQDLLEFIDDHPKAAMKEKLEQMVDGRKRALFENLHKPDQSDYARCLKLLNCGHKSTCTVGDICKWEMAGEESKYTVSRWRHSWWYRTVSDAFCWLEQFCWDVIVFSVSILLLIERRLYLFVCFLF